MDDPFGRWCIVFLALLFSAFLTACETAIRHADEDDLPSGEKTLERYVLQFRIPVTSLQAVRLLLWFVALWQAIAALPALWWARLILCVGMTVLIEVLCVILPSRLAKQAPEKTLCRFKGLCIAVCTIALPFTYFLKGLAGIVLKPFGLEAREKDEVTEEEIKQLIEVGEETGAIEQSEHEMIDNVLEFNDLTAADCMTHRTDVTALRLSDSSASILNTIRTTGLSRFPVYDGDIDDIVGILTARDYLLNLSLDKPKPLTALLRKPYMVPETVKTDVLLHNMQRAKTHIAIVVDEYGGVSGIVTMEDLLEEIVGNIYDEYDTPDEAEFECLGPDQWEVSGTADLETLEEEMNVTLPKDDYDTFGGLIFSRFGVIPADGSTPEVDIWCTPDGEAPEAEDDDEEVPKADLMHVKVRRINDRRVEKAVVVISRDVPVQPEDTQEESE